MQTIKLNYPSITEQPEHRAANEKLERFLAEHKEAQQVLDRLNQEHAARFEAGQKDAGGDPIGDADALLAGRMTDTIDKQITDAVRAVDVLSKAIAAQQLVLADVNRTLSQEAGKKFMPQHKAIVKKMAAAVQALHDANKEEWMLRDELVRLGYMGATVPAMEYTGASDPNDNTGSTAYYWMQHSAPYIQASK